MINYNLPKPFKAFVWEGVLYDLDPSYDKWVECEIIAVSSYPGDALCFTILVSNTKSLFCYIPFHYVKWKESNASMSLDELVYHNCPSGIMSFTVLNVPKIVKVWNKKAKEWMYGEYVSSIDWYEDNLMSHIIKLNNGCIAMQPHHKILFGDADQLPKYKKLHAEWKV